MKSILILLIALLAFNKIRASEVNYADTAKVYSRKLATADIKAGNLKFLLRGGIVSTYRKGQEVFEKKYRLKYSDFGCVMPSNISIDDYNRIVAGYLDKKFGLSWRNEVRKDVAGI
ncbi:hypothetical protein [Pedobacter sp. Leaf176]|uniref:FEKKY domain-containing protein n=1 Tax=Pedobacter sp. Leaf176 TaxID=1736286 RepID=UPI0006FC2287|nr:hypothetical protein [Pedobacter sp. Leaf176]KQR70236.1 hypothetical protein ASF92_09565 [Pedobacter sp. Leaf176]